MKTCQLIILYDHPLKQNLKKLMMKALLKRAFGINYFFYGHEKQLILQIREIWK